IKLVFEGPDMGHLHYSTASHSYTSPSVAGSPKITLDYDMGARLELLTQQHQPMEAFAKMRQEYPQRWERLVEQHGAERLQAFIVNKRKYVLEKSVRPVTCLDYLFCELRLAGVQKLTQQDLLLISQELANTPPLSRRHKPLL
ncbi:hypothetical protein FOZ63_019624, partial [Perkinsus olseni]